MRIRHASLALLVFLTPFGLVATRNHVHDEPAAAIKVSYREPSPGIVAALEDARTQQIEQEAAASIAAQAAVQADIDAKTAAEAKATSDAAQAETDAANERQAARSAQAHATATTVSTTAKVAATPKPRPATSTGTGACGGSLPPCYVMQRESQGSLTVYNTQGSGASGKWQFMPGTWDGYGGYANAADAPEAVQDARATQVWAGGAGCANWAACG